MKKIYSLLIGMTLCAVSVVSHAWPPSDECLLYRLGVDLAHDELVNCKAALPESPSEDCLSARLEKDYYHGELVACKEAYGPNWKDIQTNCADERVLFSVMIGQVEAVCPGVDSEEFNCDSERQAFHFYIDAAADACPGN